MIIIAVINPPNAILGDDIDGIEVTNNKKIPTIYTPQNILMVLNFPKYVSANHPPKIGVT